MCFEIVRIQQSKLSMIWKFPIISTDQHATCADHLTEQQIYDSPENWIFSLYASCKYYVFFKNFGDTPLLGNSGNSHKYLPSTVRHNMILFWLSILSIDQPRFDMIWGTCHTGRASFLETPAAPALRNIDLKDWNPIPLHLAQVSTTAACMESVSFHEVKTEVHPR